MGKIELLDCTLRDGGYVNDWTFTYQGMCKFCEKIVKTNVEYTELGFIRGVSYDKEKALFPNAESFKNIIGKKSNNIIYLAMYDTSNPIDIETFGTNDHTSIDGVRVIFKNTKIDEGVDACKKFKKLGYKVVANFVNTEKFSKEQLEYAINEFNNEDVYAMSIVDTFGDLNNTEFLNLVNIFNSLMKKSIALCYHAHNNLQQAFQNSQSLVELNLERDIIIDASVFGMGRGAGNLNLELFAKYLNDHYEKDYHIVPMLEIMDECLQDFYKEKFWGYSLPLYISASLKVHPNYAIYLASKNTLTEKALFDILQMIDDDSKVNYNKNIAEEYYQKYQENLIDDKIAKEELYNIFNNKTIVLLAPGNTLNTHASAIAKELQKENTIAIALNFYPEQFKPEYVFSSNMRRYSKIDNDNRFKSIITSNMREAKKKDYFVNYSNLLSKEKEIDDNSGLMILRLLIDLGVKNVEVAGMDGYNTSNIDVYVDESTFFDFSNEAEKRNQLINKELKTLAKSINIKFITPSCYVI